MLRPSPFVTVPVVLFVLMIGILESRVPAAQNSGGQAGVQDATAKPVPRYDVKRTTGAITIDGRLDEAAWKAASAPAVLQPLWDYQTGLAQSTRAWLLWDDDKLYVGYDVEDIDITAQYLERDDPTYLDDAVEIFINPRPSQVGLYLGLEMNARAVLYDYAMYDSSTGLIGLKLFDMKGVQVATHLRGTLNARGDKDEGWSLEVSIPWSNFADMAPRPTPGTMWSANLNRWDGVAPDRRMSIWSDPLRPRAQPHVPARFGELRFVE